MQSQTKAEQQQRKIREDPMKQGIDPAAMRSDYCKLDQNESQP